MGGLCLAWYLWPEPPLDEQADRLLQAILSGNARSLTKMISVSEVEEMGLQQAHVPKVLEELVLPKYSGWTLTSREEKQVKGEGSFGFCQYEAQHTSGLRTKINIAVWDSDDGPFITIQELLSQGMRLEYHLQHPSQADYSPEYKIWALKKDADKMQKLGITKLRVGALTQPPVSIEEAISYYERLLPQVLLQRNSVLVKNDQGRWVLVPKKAK